MTSNGVDDTEMKVKGNISSSELPPASSRSLFGYTVLALGLALFIRFFVAAPYIVEGPSMEPTFFGWDYLIIDKVVYNMKSPARGEVIVFTLPQDASRSLIKRVIGLPGEKVTISGSQITIINANHPDGFTLEEPYVEAKNATSGEKLERTLGSNEYFVMGDNRQVSSDSRIWGNLPEKNISGRVGLRLFPFGEISVVPGKFNYAD
ncbi:signal peptidase I [Candidatus Kaiserbacteria bacterium RIFCSPHIGHO2_02_FULL_49_16]|uniref:Signal peptidase I n=1 Tax=Candidatus Kaiserbacteria bacterium RIFCSPHIGHO2_02_FULL_49_16 TaxID=1798490 RepID=A0A1F6DHS5_9BACT|nr:MAG: signal peptidase I [Candidatus Kaiserbacteria bacterium RIFCSPHIGHO2_02_FULL_49_16]